ncbi:MAG: lysophospholipid acyltransferase family protein [Candidatus Aminicenantes bacterium]|nr:MAG: lysophospholipid acyltransferase family protein [Candidatus Aminicenantes bacterium]
MASLHEKTEFFGFQFLKIPFSVLPRPICLAIGGALGSLIYRIDRKHRLIALSNLKTAFGSQFSVAQQKEIAMSSFRHFGSVFADIIKVRHMKRGKVLRLLTIEGTEHLEKAVLKGKGVLIFSAHLGNWEMATALVSQIGKVNVIARALDNRLLEKELLKIRKKLGANVIYKQQAARPILRALEAKEIVAILIDQNVVRNQAVFVDFFGKPAATTPSLASFFLKTNAPIVPVFCYPVRKGKYHLKILQSLKITVTDKEEQDVLKITQLCTKIIQNQIQENPNVWLWFHDRWKTRPEGEE